jgi:hypothetical protein
LNVAVGKAKLGSLSLLLSYNITSSAVGTIHVLERHAKCPIFELNPDFCRQIFMKVPNIKFHENPSSESRTDKCAKTAGWKEAKKQSSKKGAFRYF